MGNEELRRKRILVVDDEPDVVETVRFRLEQDGYEVLVATNGLEGLGAAHAHRPDLTILDVMMPGENGYRVSKMLREDEDAGLYPRRMAILLLTARDLSGDPEREQTFMEFSRADAMMYKPFELDALVRKVEELLGESADAEEPEASL